MEERLYAVASDGSTPGARVSDQAARAPCYLLFDATGTILDALENPVTDTAGHAAPQTAAFLEG